MSALVSFAAATAPLEPISVDDVRTAFELIAHVDAGAAVHNVPVNVGGVDAIAVAAQPRTAQDAAIELNETGAVDNSVALNAASDVINDVYAFTRYWANYVALQLGPWVINWVPFGYLVSDQIRMWYSNFVLPVVDSFVYDFLDPVVNEPLNPGVWLQGLGDIVDAAATGVYNGIVSEIRYIVTFGWLPFPLPPLPSFPLPTAAESTDPVELSSIEADATDVDVVEEISDQPGADVDIEPDVAGTDESVADTEIPADEQPGLDADAPDKNIDESAGEESDDVVDEAPDEIVDDAEEPAADTEPEPADQSGDGEAGADAGDETEPTGTDTPDDTDSGDGGDASGSLKRP